MHNAIMYTVHIEVARFELVPKDIKVPPIHTLLPSAPSSSVGNKECLTGIQKILDGS